MEYNDDYEYNYDEYVVSSEDFQNVVKPASFNFFSYDKIQFASEEQTKKEFEQMVKEFVDDFGISQGLAIFLLLKAKANRLKAELFLQDDPSVVPQLQKANSFFLKCKECPICFDDLSDNNSVFPSNCEHKCCKHCLNCYVDSETLSNHQLPFKCIQEGCGEFLSLDTVQKFLSLSMKPKLTKILINAIVLNSERLKFCPGPNCGLIIKFNQVLNQKKPINIRCSCGTCFCSSCNREAHLPLSCELFIEWDSLHSKGSDQFTESWLQLKTKKCPKCNTPIEKNKGCMHMTCGNCRYEFCWLCMQDWTKHGNETGGFYRCNMFTPNSEEDEKKNKIANDLQRFKFLSDRYIEHKKSVLLSEKKKLKMMKEYNEIIKSLQQPHDEYLLNALNLIIDCRRAISYSYGVAYFLKDNAKLAFFQFLQNQAESFLENLDNDTDKELKEYVNKEVSGAFNDKYYIWSNNIKTKTQTLISFFNQILHDLETGLPSVKHGVLERQDSLYKEKDEYMTTWICPICTLANDLSIDRCDACDNPRPQIVN